jgi:hypothetical protein
VALCPQRNLENAAAAAAAYTVNKKFGAAVLDVDRTWNYVHATTSGVVDITHEGVSYQLDLDFLRELFEMILGFIASIIEICPMSAETLADTMVKPRFWDRVRLRMMARRYFSCCETITYHQAVDAMLAIPVDETDSLHAIHFVRDPANGFVE